MTGFAALLYAVWLAEQFGLYTLYADQWRIYGMIIELPFPEGLLVDQNGHRPLVPNLVQYFNSFVLKRDQQSVMWFGLMLALVFIAMLVVLVYRSERLDSGDKIILSSLAMVSVLHVSNGVILFHSNESVHSYPVLIALLAGLWLLARPTAREASSHGSFRRIILEAAALAVLGFLGSLSFGAGAVIFPTYILIALLIRRPVPLVALTVLSWAALLIAYLGMLPENPVKSPFASHGIGVDGTGFSWLVSIFRWMSAPVSSMFELSVLQYCFSQDRWQDLTQLVRYHVAPATAGCIFLFLAILTVRRFFKASSGSALEDVLLGLGIAMVAIGCLVAYTRRDLWQTLPVSVFSSRFYVWSSLIWLAGVSLAYLKLRQSRIQYAATVALVPPIFYMALLLGSNITDASRAELLESRQRSLDTSLRTAMDLHPGNYWEWIGVTKPTQIQRVGREFKRLGIPILDLDFERRYLTQVSDNAPVTAPPLEGGIHEVSARRPPFASITVVTADNADRIIVVGPGRKISGLLLAEPVYHSPLSVLVPGNVQTRIYRGYIGNFQDDASYYYLAEDAGGKLSLGPLTLALDKATGG